ncbi:hypothetical protein Fot_53121 [Forsythia ovata]|uniref:Uncharacterized protein n=1 Tax=Forsythia ovata TaxID=205694 RepID=A0ABD1PHA0_9LAMI
MEEEEIDWKNKTHLVLQANSRDYDHVSHNEIHISLDCEKLQKIFALSPTKSDKSIKFDQECYLENANENLHFYVKYVLPNHYLQKHNEPTVGWDYLGAHSQHGHHIL